tara:strand:- start:1308 stop:1532 length:225 start_codon:yes stop_codon:yes gene_type:complete
MKRVPIAASIYCQRDFVIRGKSAVMNTCVDTTNILINDSTSAEIQMSHFRIAHLAYRETNGFSTGFKGCTWKSF